METETELDIAQGKLQQHAYQLWQLTEKTPSPGNVLAMDDAIAPVLDSIEEVKKLA